jgi:hypothetical protein
MTTYCIRRLHILTAVLLASAFTAAVPASATAHQSHRSAHHARRHHHSGGGIPQHNGGDHDSDNSGAPSDGDGNV